MGNVGINTQSPAFDLDVSGVMKASKGIKIPYMNFTTGSLNFPFMTQTGTYTYSSVNPLPGFDNDVITVSFATPFTSSVPPVVVVTPTCDGHFGSVIHSIFDITSVGFSVYIYNASSQDVSGVIGGTFVSYGSAT